MTATLEDIHRDPAILDRAIANREPLQVYSEGKKAGTFLPEPLSSTQEPYKRSLRGFPISKGGKPITSEDVAAAEAEDDLRL